MRPAIIELTAPDISCARCKDNIEGGLASEPRIQQVSVDVGARRVRVAYDRSTPAPPSCGELSEIGYPQTP